MRLITEIEGIVYEEKRNNKINENKNINLKVNSMNTLFLKNLDFRNTKIILINKVDKISKEKEVCGATHTLLRTLSIRAPQGTVSSLV